MMRRFYAWCFLLLISCFLLTCRKDVSVTDSGFPREIATIMRTKCATPGCHTETSKDVAAGLSLETWDQLFEGDRNGAVCIPYSPEYSTLFLFTNTYADLGAINEPTMPYKKTPLSRDEMTTLTNWIKRGAPNSAGKIAFGDNPNRKKIYVTNRECDVVTVFDAATRIQMRYINVGAAPEIESPHMVKVSPDGKYWYVIFSDTARHLQKFRTSDDTRVGELDISIGRWSSFSISNDSKYGFAVDSRPDGRIAYIDLDNMSLLGISPGPAWPDFWDALGSALNAKGDTLYVTAYWGNYIHKIPVNNPLLSQKVVLNPPAIITTATLFDPYHISFSPDSLYYYVTCQESNEVRVMRISDDTIWKVIPTGKFPQGMAFSTNPNTPYLFITCEKDNSGAYPNLGSVTVVNYKTNSVIDNLRLNMSQPHGIAVDDANGLVYVGNRNKNAGYSPHHTSNCGGTNGFISFIDLHTLQVIDGKIIEVATDPYSIAVRK